MKAFTLIELLLVIAIITIITGYSAPFLSTFLRRNSWHTTVDRVASEINKAQSYAMDGKSVSGNTIWGVCVTGNVFRMFNGSCETPNLKEDFDIAYGVNISGLTSITFSNSRGEPSSPTTILVSTTLGSNTISINAAGMVQVN